MEYKVSLQNPWFDFIQSGLKTYEGRVNWKIWSGLKIGDKIIFKNKNNHIHVIVTEIKKYANFIDAYDDLGTSLIPNLEINRDNLMNQVYGTFYSDKDILDFGVVAIGIRVI